MKWYGMSSVVRKIKRRVEEDIVDITCDICKIAKGKPQCYLGGKHGHEINWKHESYSTLESAIYYRVGDQYPEGDFTSYYELHICTECMEEKVFPLLCERFNLNIQEREAE